MRAKLLTGVTAVALLWALVQGPAPAAAQEAKDAAKASQKAVSDEVDRIQDSAQILDEIMAAPDKGIPRDLLSKAHCVVIIPSMKEGAFIFGAKYGKGVMTCRNSGRTGWSGPSNIRIEGGSFGLQIGGTATDVVMLVMNQEGARKLMQREFTLGADAKVAAGPVGRSAEAQTDIGLDAQILSYSRSKGAFAGLALEGATLRPDDSDNEKLYGRKVTHEEILLGKVPPPAAAKVLENTLNKYSPAEKS